MILFDNSQAAHALAAGNVGVIPTDTLYGLVAKATNAAAVGRLHALKYRNRKPGTVIASNISQLRSLGISNQDIQAVEALWPSPLSIIFTPEADTLPHLHQGLGDFPVRIPADESLREFLEISGPLVTSSANFAGEEPAGTIAQAYNYFGDKVNFYVDGGDLSGRLPSTVARVTDRGIIVLRQGAYTVPAAQLYRA